MAVFAYDPWLEEFTEAGRYDFQWDSGNRTKNWRRHGVTIQECEEVFLSGALPVVFTLRGGRIRVISARPMNQEEREDYDLLR